MTVEVGNGLPETTTTHWHGMRLPAVMDGGPHQPIRPRATWRPAWKVDQPAATLWYHPHLHQHRRPAFVYIVGHDQGEVVLFTTRSEGGGVEQTEQKVRSGLTTP